MKQSGIAVTLLTIQCFRMFQRPKWHRRRSHPYQLQLAVSPTEQFCRVHHNLWILSLFILKVSFFQWILRERNKTEISSSFFKPWRAEMLHFSQWGFPNFFMLHLHTWFPYIYIISYITSLTYMMLPVF